MRRYVDRDHAARVLAEQASAYAGTHPLVLAIPRGAVPIAARLAEHLDGDLDVVLVRKLGAPGNPEFAIGSIDEAGMVHLSPDAACIAGGNHYLQRKAAEELETIRRRRALYAPARPPIDPSGRVVIIVDDGIATGYTMLAALAAVRPRGPKKLVAAVPVGSAEAVALVRAQADDVVCPIVDPAFGSVGQYFDSFPQVSDEQVGAMLRRAQHHTISHHG